MFRNSVRWSLLFLLLTATSIAAQTGQGSLRGYVKDESGGALPGVTVTATSPALIQPTTAVTDAEGYYRLINLPPGTYTIVAELTGFATHRREGVVLQAGANFQVEVTMKIGALQETVTVAGESPMLEVSKPSNILNISGEFQRELPIQARRNWSDFLEITPGVHSRPFDDGSGRMVYFGHATEHFAHVVQLEGAIASNYQDAQITYIAMGADMIDETTVKTGGVDASAPMGTGLNINVVTKSGGNTFKGSAAYAYQPFGWNDNNVDNCTASASCFPGTGGTPTTAYVRQFDGGLGGPIKRDRVWFFGALRRANSQSGISRTADNIRWLQTFNPGLTLFNNSAEGWQPYIKVTGKPTSTQEIVGFYQADRTKLTGNREYHYTPAVVGSTGGGVFGAKLTSVWTSSLTTTILASYNNKGGSDASTYDGVLGTGPDTTYHQRFTIQGGRATGSGRLAEGGNLDTGSGDISPSSLYTLRADLTYFKNAAGGSHEIQTGFFAEPLSKYDTTTFYVNNGFIQEERAFIDPSDPARGTIPFHRQYVDQTELRTRAARDHNWAFYLQDSWKPSERLTANIGVRFDWVKRFDDIFKIDRENAHIVQPRLGFSYLLTSDAKTVLRASYMRAGEQMMGRDAVTLFGAASRVGRRDEYDNNSDGIFETVIVTPATSATIANYQFDPNLHQPYVDEFIVGFRKQFPGRIAVDVAGINRAYKDTYARLEINGFYPAGPNQPFGGFGAVDPTQGTVLQQTNNSWSQLNYTALEITITKQMSQHFQAMAGINRQWQHISGDWNPHDPAKFVQPNAFANDKLLYQPRGNNEENSLPLTTGTNTLTYGPTWQQYRLNFAGTYQAPFGVTLAASYTVEAGPWSGAIVTLLDPTDPALAVFGPSLIRLSNGTTASNPLSTRMRFVYPTRGDGQVMAPPVKTFGLKFGKLIPLGASRQAEIAANVFNILNAGDYTQYNYSGASETFNPNYLQMRNQQPARALQMTVVYRF
jgi:carboxypeptidase family protein/TonB-dependent receptor-like protein